MNNDDVRLYRDDGLGKVFKNLSLKGLKILNCHFSLTET